MMKSMTSQEVRYFAQVIEVNAITWLKLVIIYPASHFKARIGISLVFPSNSLAFRSQTETRFLLRPMSRLCVCLLPVWCMAPRSASALLAGSYGSSDVWPCPGEQCRPSFDPNLMNTQHYFSVSHH